MRYLRNLPPLVALLIVPILLAVSVEIAHSQLRGQAGTGREVGGGGLLGALRSEAIRSELDLTDEQTRQLEKLFTQSGDASDVRDLLQRMREADTEKERAALREQMRQSFAQRRQQADKQLTAILNEQQLNRLQQIVLQRRGVGALVDEKNVAELGLSDDQITQIEELLAGRERARRELGIRASEEQKDAVAAEWDAKILGVLAPDQRRKWEEKTGPPLGTGEPQPAATGSDDASSSSAAAADPSRPAPVEAALPEDGTAIASFGAAEQRRPTSTDTRTSLTSNTDDVRLSFNFRYAPWDVVLQRFADVAGLTLDLKDVPPGTFNHFDQKQYTITEALDVINGYLLARGYVLVRRDNFLVSIRYDTDEGVPPNLVPIVDASELYERGRNELLTVIFPLGGAEVAQVAEAVEGMVGPQGKVVGMAPTNSLMVTDIGSILRRVQRTLSNIAPGSEDMFFKPYPLEHISAEEAELLVKQMVGVPTGVTNVSSSASSRNSSRDRDFRSRFGRFSRRFRDDDDDRRSNAASASVDLSKARIVADPRTNRLLATATASEHRIIEAAVKTIDVEATGSFLSKKPYLYTYAVKTSDAREVARSIDVIMPGVVVNEDGRNDLVSIYATPAQHEQVRDLINRLDGAGGGSQVDVIPLSNMDPSVAVATLQGMFRSDGDEAPTIQADLYGRQVMVRGTESQILQVRQLLADLGEDGTGTARANRGPVRTFNLSSRDPAEVLPILQQIWKARTGSSIHVVNPPGEARSGPRVIDSDPSLGEEPPDDTSSFPTKEAQGEETDRLGAQHESIGDPFEVSVETDEVGSDAAADSAPSPTETEEAHGDSSFTAIEEPAGPVTVQVTGGDLMLISRDQEALDQMERTLEDVLKAVPPRTTWTVIPLQSADATEAAAMLQQLFPDSSVSQTSGATSSLFGTLTEGINSFGSSVGDMTGLSSLVTGPQSLRIIPDVRLNALFVSGPSYRVDEVRQMLEVLDASGLTESLRDRSPRMIPVRHADIGEVYEIVRSVYEPEMQAGSRAGGNASGGFAAFLGGGGRGRRGGDDENGGAGEPEVTLGVDRTTSNLIVSASESTFLEIERLVQSIDRAAREARRTVRVLALENTNATVVQNSLTSLMPKVTVSTTSSTSRPSSSASPARSSGSSAPDIEQFRQRMEFFRRLREQRQSGGDSSNGADRDGRSRNGSRFGDGGFRGRDFWRNRFGGEGDNDDGGSRRRGR